MRNQTESILPWLGFAGFMIFIALVLPMVAWIGSPAGVANKTLNANNIIHTYEWFYDVSEKINTKQADIEGHRTVMKVAMYTPAGHERALMELNTLQMSCRDLVGKYNAQAAKANKAIFKTDSTPQNFNLSVCD